MTDPSVQRPDLRSMPLEEVLRWYAEHGEPDDPRTDIDTASLVRRFPRLARVETVDERIDGPDGTPVPIRWYRDPSAPASSRALVWVHGGAFLGGHLDMPESNWVALELAARGIPVVALDYTKCHGTAHYPIPNNEVRAAWEFARTHSCARLGVEPESLALGGASAGSTLAASVVTALIADDQPTPFGLLLVYPLLHPNGPAASALVDENAPHGQLALNYAGSVETLTDPTAFAGLGDGAGFPSTLVIVCELDELRPSGEAFAATLSAAGRDAHLYTELGAGHGHIDQPGDESALRTIEAIAGWLVRSQHPS